ncbi:hypothetical protein IWW57_002347 [Coemansia sp. S610]|nr:hypothetical protein IWW57_002347 [Coemansia sp. S610]KAJ2412063.1 hypothetical protein GGI10_003907 [Coemansia sp. RSA 2530]
MAKEWNRELDAQRMHTLDLIRKKLVKAKAEEATATKEVAEADVKRIAVIEDLKKKKRTRLDAARETYQTAVAEVNSAYMAEETKVVNDSIADMEYLDQLAQATTAARDNLKEFAAKQGYNDRFWADIGTTIGTRV